MRHRIGIEQLSVFGMPPVEFVNLAADLGCSCISTGLTGFGYNPQNYPVFSLRDDPALRREMIAAMQDRGIAISLGEGCNIRADTDIRDFAADLDIMAELGAERINTVSLDPDHGRTLDQLAIFAEMVGARGMVSTVELCPVLTINNLETAIAAIRHVGRADFRLLIDAMHLARSGATEAEIAALDPALIDYFQLCDAPREPIDPNYMMEATFERRVPGEGELPLASYAAILPAGTVVSLEVPMRSKAELGMPPLDRLRPCVAAAKALVG